MFIYLSMVKMFLNKNCVTKLQKNAYTFHSLYFQTDAGNQEFFVEGKWKAYLKGIVDIQVKTILLSAFNILHYRTILILFLSPIKLLL